jgi:hypothetical protein
LVALLSFPRTVLSLKQSTEPTQVQPDVVLLWFVAMLVVDSQDKSRIFGVVALSIALCFELYSHILRFGGTSDSGILKLLMLLPFVWLLFESTKKPYLT